MRFLVVGRRSDTVRWLEPRAPSCRLRGKRHPLERVLTRANLQRALKQVRSNRGAPGINGMSVDELPDYLREHWVEIRAKLVSRTYRPQHRRFVSTIRIELTA